VARRVSLSCGEWDSKVRNAAFVVRLAELRQAQRVVAWWSAVGGWAEAACLPQGEGAKAWPNRLPPCEELLVVRNARRNEDSV